MGSFYIRVPSSTRASGRWELVSTDGEGPRPDAAGVLRLKMPDGTWKQHRRFGDGGATALRLDTREGWQTVVHMGDAHERRWVAYLPMALNVAGPTSGYRGSVGWNAEWDRTWKQSPPGLPSYDGSLVYEGYPMDTSSIYEGAPYIMAAGSSGLFWNQNSGEFLRDSEHRSHPEWGWYSWHQQRTQYIPIDLALIRSHFEPSEGYVEFQIRGDTTELGTWGRLWLNDSVIPVGDYLMYGRMAGAEWMVGESTVAVRSAPFTNVGTTLLGEWDLASLPLPEYSNVDTPPGPPVIYRYPLRASDFTDRTSLVFQVTTSIAPESAHSAATPKPGTYDFTAELHSNAFWVMPVVHFYG